MTTTRRRTIEGDLAAMRRSFTREATRARARLIDGADHDPRPQPLTGVCRICGVVTRTDPRTPGARIHVS